MQMSPLPDLHSIFRSHTGNLNMDINAVQHRPEIRFWYLVMTAGAHLQGFCVSKKFPHGQGVHRRDQLKVCSRLTANLVFIEWA